MSSSNTQPHRIDARGKPGAAGAAGRNGQGEAGGQGQAAGKGGRIALSARLESGKLVLSGEVVAPRNPDARSLYTSALPLHELSVVELLARGGQGGRGGDGGRGARGYEGSRGSDATRYSSGGDGGRGGDGGDGGDAGMGGNGGQGGNVQLAIAPDDLDLALLFEWDVNGGPGGGPGEPGSGGEGGAGGAGGSSYSWTESETYTDANGNSQTRSVSRSNSGGSRGPSGDPGRDGSHSPPGPPGQPGAFKLLVAESSYSDRYRLECSGFLVVSSGDDALLEFGERGNRVEDVRLRNSSEAPSPGQNLQLRLAQRPGVQPHPMALPVPALRKKEGVTLRGLTFDLDEAPAERLPSLHHRLRRTVVIDPEVLFTRLDRIAPEAANPRQVEVTFPVELETLASPNSLMPGQTIQQRWVVRNLSRYEFPSQGRHLTVELAKPSGDSNLRVYDNNGEPIALGPEPVTYLEIPPLPPGAEQVVTVYVSFAGGTPPYSAVEISAALRLTPRYGGEAREIQRNPVSFSAALAYRGDNAEVLLVTHSGNTAEEVKEWGELLDRLGLRWDVWDAAWHGDLPILALAPKISGKLVVLLNAPFQSPERVDIHAGDLMSLDEFREAVSKHGISFYSIGTRSELPQHLLPLGEDFQQHASPGDYLDSIEPHSGPNPEVPCDMTTRLDQVAIARFHVAADPEPADLEKQARKLLATLRERFPDRRFVLSAHFQPRAEESGWFRKRSYGFVRVRQLPDADARAVVTREVYRKTGQKPAFIRSTENLLGLFSAMDFDDKLGVANGLVESRSFAVAPLADAWLLDLGEEQMVLRRSGIHSGKRRIRELLNRTRDLCQHDFRLEGASLAVDSPTGQLLIRMAAGLSFLSRARLHWSDHRLRLFGGTNEVEISEVVDELVDGMLDLNFGADPLVGKAPKARAEADTLIHARCRELESAATAVEASGGGEITRKDSALEALVRWDLRDYLESDGGLRDGLYEPAVLEALKADEHSATARRAALLDLFRQAAAAGELPDDAPFQECSPA